MATLKMIYWLSLLSLLTPNLTNAALAESLVDIPAYVVPITDLTGTLSQGQKTQLDYRLTAIKQDKGAQVAILLLPSVKPETIEQFGIRLAESWKIGRRGIDDGVIVVVAKSDRKMRIEVGYGLEGAIPDAVAKRIISEIMVPRFKQEHYFGGLSEAVNALEKQISGESLPAPARKIEPKVSQGTGEVDYYFLIYFFSLCAIVLALVYFMFRHFSWWQGPLLAALFFAALSRDLASSTLVGAIVGLVVFLIGVMLSSKEDSYDSGSTGSGGSSSDYSSGGVGDSGGGGDFGGGGASGDW